MSRESSTGQEEDDIKNLSDEYYAGLSKEDLDYMQVSKEEVSEFYRKYYRADKTVSQMTESRNLEVSDAGSKSDPGRTYGNGFKGKGR